jgi:hypothetical protein
MVSGIFIVGNGISLEDFEGVYSNLKNQGYDVHDQTEIIYAPYPKTSIFETGILISLVGDNLEYGLDKALSQKAEEIQSKVRSVKGHEDWDAYMETQPFIHLSSEGGLSKGIYKKVGIYNDNTRAHTLYNSFVQKYLADEVADSTEALANELAKLRKELAKLEKKMKTSQKK